MRNKILEYFKKSHEYVSGDELGQHLGISRQGLWKYIQDLKDLGYDFAAVPHLGYRLESCPDKLLDFEVGYRLNTKFIGKQIKYFNDLASTMDYAMQLGMENAAAGTLVLAESQTKGRGRLGRSWYSPKYKGLYLSLILRPDMPLAQAPILTLFSAVSVCEAVKAVTGVDSRIKWPNDILVRQKKLGGILTEVSAETDKINFVIIGLGLNVNNDKKDLISGATSIKNELKENINRVNLLQEILRRMEQNYLLLTHKGGPAITEKWREHNLTLGRRVKVYSQKEHYEGEAVNIDRDGSLLLRDDHGLVRKITAGDVVHCR